MFAVALYEQFFLHPTDIGAAHESRFNPIPHATLALLFTIVRFLACLVSQFYRH